MIELAAPLALLAAPLALAPIVLHFVRRRRPRDRSWGLVRFLAVVVAEQRRRLVLNERLLLILRVAALAAAALAAARPAWVERAPVAPALVRAGRVACVLCLDDSAGSAVAGGDATVRALAQAWLSTLLPGDEVTVLPLSRLADPTADPLVDLTAARAQIDALRATAVPGDHPGLLLAGLDRLHGHLNPHAELVLVSAGRSTAWRATDPRWSELTRRLAGGEVGSRARPHLIVLEAPAAAVPDLAVIALDAGASSFPPRATPRLQVVIALRGGDRPRSATLRCELDGRIVDERRVEVPPGGEVAAAVSLPPLDPGDHLVTARLMDAADAVPLSDLRAAVLTVEARLPVVLVEAIPGSGLAGSLGAVAAALDPEAGTDALAAFAPRRVPATALADGEHAERLLTGARALVLGGIPTLDPGALAAIERFVAGGGGLVVVPGDGVDAGHWAQAWWRGGDGVLPCAPGAAIAYDPPLGLLAPPASSHPLSAIFVGAGGAALNAVGTRRGLVLPRPGAGAPPDAEAPLLLVDGTPLIVERRRGAGRSALIACALDGSWSDLPWRAAFVPLMRELVRDVAGRPTPPRELIPGQRPAFIGAAPEARLTGPDGTAVAPERSPWEGHPALLGPPVAAPGGWELRAADGRVLARWACVVPPEAFDPAPTAIADTAAVTALGALHATDATSARALVAGGARRGSELWPWLIALALTALLIEAWACGRIASDEAGGG